MFEIPPSYLDFLACVPGHVDDFLVKELTDLLGHRQEAAQEVLHPTCFILQPPELLLQLLHLHRQ